MIHSGVLFVARANFQQFNLSRTMTGLKWFCVCVMATNLLELATALKYLGAKWLPGKKLILRPVKVSEMTIIIFDGVIKA